MDVEAEIRDLKRRVDELESPFGFLIRQVQGVHKDLLAFDARTERRFDKVDARFGRVEGRLERMESGIRRLREDMPAIVGDAIRAAMRGRSGSTRKKS
jgi:hypothetical protein